jgi:rod shape determining protein RodA
MRKNFSISMLSLILLVLIMAIFGVVIIGSATHINSVGNSDVYVAQKLWIVLGLFLMIISAIVDYRFITKLYIFIYVLNIVMLVAVFFLDNSDSTNVTRWLRIAGFGIQPSEFSKVFMILFLAKYIEMYKDKINSIFILLGILLLTSIPIAITLRQPSLSAAIVVLVIMLGMLFVAKLSYKYIITAIFVIFPIVVVFYFDILKENPVFLTIFLKGYQIDRLKLFLNPDINNEKYYQTLQSINAIGSGEYFGKGLYKGTLNNFNFLYQSHNDFIFSIVGEEFGFLGCSFVLISMFMIVVLCMFIASKAVDLQGRLIASAVSFMFAFQTFVNVGVATGLLPNTGMPFPFLSYGGSAMFVNLIAAGLVLNVGKYKIKSFF